MTRRPSPLKIAAGSLGAAAILVFAGLYAAAMAQQNVPAQKLPPPRAQPKAAQTPGQQPAQQPGHLPATASQEPAMQPSPVGVWIDHTGRGAVEIAQCGPGLCGRIVWMKQPLDKAGRPLRDSMNENVRLRDRSICGLQVIGGVQPMRDGSWDRGWIYDPEQGESFDVELRLRAPDVLQVKGYKGLKFLSETYQWRRAVELPQPSCPPPSPA